MSNHVRIYNTAPDFIRRGGTPPPLGISGELPNYSDGVDYNSRLQVTNPIGRFRVELLSGTLPLGYQLFADNFSKEIVVKFPAQFGGGSQSGIPNGDFDEGAAGWELPTGWAVETVPYGSDSNNKALVYRGAGNGRARSDWFPLTGSPYIGFEALWNQGPSNKDNVDLRTNILFQDAAGNITRREGSKVGGMSNKSWHLSSGASSPTTGAIRAAIELDVYRRNSRNREVLVDNADWTLTFPTYTPTGDFPISLRVTDSAGRTADWSGTISSVVIDPIAVSIWSKLTEWWEMDELSSSGHIPRVGLKAATILSPNAASNAQGVRGNGDVAAKLASGGGRLASTSTPSGHVLRVPVSGRYVIGGWYFIPAFTGPAYRPICTKWDSRLAPTMEAALSVGQASDLYGQMGGSGYHNVLDTAPNGQWNFVVLWADAGRIVRMKVNNRPVVSSAAASNFAPTDRPWEWGSPVGGESSGEISVQRWFYIKENVLTSEEMSWLYNGGQSRKGSELKSLAGA